MLFNMKLTLLGKKIALGLSFSNTKLQASEINFKKTVRLSSYKKKKKKQTTVLHYGLLRFCPPFIFCIFNCCT